MPEEVVGNKLGESDWELLLKRIAEGRCTPFLGAGVCYGTLPLGSEIAAAWAKKEEFPLDDCSDLAKVAQDVTRLARNTPRMPRCRRARKT